MGRNAVILVDKGPGITSFDCLGRIKHNVNPKTGHCGTLDKFAHGLMIVLSGSFTHLVPVFMGMDKTYEAVIEFGKMTDTLDPEGAVIETGPVPSGDTVRHAVERLVGEMDQVPPAYSAIHVNGKRSYQIARSGDLNLELKPRPVTIYSAELLFWDAPYATVRLHVSKGTYVRSYARDLGHECSSCAYVKELFRTGIGPFSIDEAISYDDIQAMKELPEPLGILRRLPGCCEVALTGQEAFKASNGYVMPSVLEKIPGSASFAVLERSGSMVCIYSAAQKKIICQVAGPTGAGQEKGGR